MTVITNEQHIVVAVALIPGLGVLPPGYHVYFPAQLPRGMVKDGDYYVDDTPTLTAPVRQDGYYWIKAEGSWYVAKWRPVNGSESMRYWHLIRNGNLCITDIPEEINENRIPAPDEVAVDGPMNLSKGDLLVRNNTTGKIQTADTPLIPAVEKYGAPASVANADLYKMLADGCEFLRKHTTSVKHLSFIYKGTYYDLDHLSQKSKEELMKLFNKNGIDYECEEQEG